MTDTERIDKFQKILHSVIQLSSRTSLTTGNVIEVSCSLGGDPLLGSYVNKDLRSIMDEVIEKHSPVGS